MQDRLPVNPGRVLITPENGGAAYYATMTRADNPTRNGTPLNKASLLKDATAALFGLGTDAVPDDVLRVLSRFQSGLGNEYIWAKSTVANTYVLTSTEGTSNLAITNDTKYGSKDNPPGQVVDLYTNFSYYKTLSVNKETGELSLSDKFTPTSVPTSSYSSYWGGLVPFYVKTTTGNVLLVKSMYSSFSDHIEFNYNWMQSSLVDEIVVIGYVNSPDPNAYPVDDGYTYTALGQLGNKVQIATGSYTGTGTYGAGNPNSLTFDFEPKVLFVVGNNKPTYYGATFLCFGYTDNFSDTNGYAYPYNLVDRAQKEFARMSGKTLEWYSTSNSYQQLNDSGIAYKYIAIG